MNKNLIGRYVWLTDTLMRYHRLTRDEISSLWQNSPFSDGNPLPDRTFYHYRRGIEENFNIRIECDTDGRYFIDKSDDSSSRSYTNLLLESFAIGNALGESGVPPGRVEIEDVPSAREFFPRVLEAISDSWKILFTYHGFNRSRPEQDILFQPYFLKLYKQRWYVVGLKEKGKSVRTYALDRVTDMRLTREKFEMNDHSEIKEQFENIIGITTSQAQLRTVRLRVTPVQAKYFRALPLHPSQQEVVHEDYSVFTYRLKLNYELVHEILALGDAVKVLEPVELKAMVVRQLKDTLSLYEN